MLYLLVLLEQIALYHVVGTAGHMALQRFLKLPDRPSRFFTQFMGICIYSPLQFCAFFINLPKNHVSTVLLAFIAAALLYILARTWPRLADFSLHARWSGTLADMGFLLLLLPLGIFWISLAIVTGYNMVPKGDGWTWVVKAVYWAFRVPLDIPGSPFSAYPPFSTLVESMNLLLLGRPEPNCSLLAMWWLHVVLLGLIFVQTTRVTNRWGGLLLISLLSLPNDFVFNVTLGYRDALMMKMVAAMSLTAVQLTRTPGNRQQSILLGLLVASTATLKDEGLLYSAICLFPMVCALLAQYRIRRFRALALDTLPVLIPPLAAISFWWSVRLGLGMKGFQGQTPSPSDIFAGVTYARLQFIALAMWGSLRAPIFGIGLLSVMVVPFKTTPKAVIQPLISTVLCLALITFVYVSTAANVEWHIQTSMSRLMFAPYALTAVFTVLCCFAGLGLARRIRLKKDF